MIVYQAKKSQFLRDVISNDIENIIHEFFARKLGFQTTKSEIKSWKNSMQYMQNVLLEEEIPSQAGITIEYQIPQTSKRIDFIITGQGAKNEEYAILIELKQWSEAQKTDKDGIIQSFVGGKVRELSHPSYQAWSYASLLEGFNEVVYRKNIKLKPCAFLHNYYPDKHIKNKCYQYYLEKAPVFLKPDTLKLSEFIKNYIKKGDATKIMERIDGGRIRPSKSLADSLSKMLQGNQEFTLIDDQKVVYENALFLAEKSNKKEKNVLIVEGGPGTGKSIVAINLLVELTKRGLSTQYVTKNSAPRQVYEEKLKGTFKKREISALFSSSGSFTQTDKNTFDTLIVDEAHRLNAKSGMFSDLGENQIKEIIHSANTSIFFIDENQKIAIKDIGKIDEIRKWSHKARANIVELDLSSQFRCNGSDGYLAWLDHTLQIRETANSTLEEIEYDFQVFDKPNELRDFIFEKNKINNKARLVAGYCWEWVSKKNSALKDITFPEYDFAMQWNLDEDGMKWIISPESVNQVGCIHTCQGLEVDYIGVIIGEDFIIRDGKAYVDPSKRDSKDGTIKGYKKLMKQDPENTKELMRLIVKNTYRTLMTRGMKGCYIYCVDKETNQYFKDSIVGKNRTFGKN